MGSNGAEHVKMSASDTVECSEATVEIKIKTLDSQTYTLRVGKCVPVPELKEQIASVTGVLSEQQRLICRGKVLKDDQLLSAYHVEDGHTLHLVVRQPLLPSLDTSADTATDPSSTAGANPGGHVRPGVLIGTFNISEHGDGTLPDMNRIISAVLNSVGGTRFGGGDEGIDLNQLPSELLTNAARRPPSDQTTTAAVPIDTMQPPVIPDSVTTLLQYLSRLSQDFLANAGGHSANAQNAGLPGGDRLEFEAALNSIEPRRLLTPESLANVLSSMRQLLLQPVSMCLEQLSGQLESQSSVVDPVERSRIQNRAIRSGVLYQNLGALLLELGRAIMTLRMGQTPADALVNAGPPVFISPAGPNPIMVQPLPFQPGTGLGSPVLGNSQHGSSLTGGSIGAGFLPRNIDIRIRTGSLLSRRDPAGLQTQVQASIPSDSTRQDATMVNRSSGDWGPIPIRTVAASIPASVGRGADSSRSPVGIIFPVLARLQSISSGTSNVSIASQASDQQLGRDSAAAQYQSVAVPGGNGNRGQGISSQTVTSGGLEQLLSTMFPGEHVIHDYATTRSAGQPAQNNGTTTQESESESESFVSDEGLLLSLMLRQLLPMLSNNAGAETSAPSTDGTNSDETQVDESPAPGSPPRHGPQTQPGSKRQRRE